MESSIWLFLGCDARKPVFGVSAQVCLKSVCSATANSSNIEIVYEYGKIWAFPISEWQNRWSILF